LPIIIDLFPYSKAFDALKIGSKYYKLLTIVLKRKYKAKKAAGG
jgi:hypothetical protein